MKVVDIMTATIYTVNQKTPLRDLWKAIFKRRIHALPVVDSQKRLMGIVTEEDLLKKLYPDYQHLVEDFVSSTDFEDLEEKIHELTKLRAEHVMNRRVIFTRSNTPILRALSRMIVRDVNQLPVLSESNVLIGVVSKGDIFDTLFKRHLRLPGFSKRKTASLRHHLAAKKKKR